MASENVYSAEYAPPRSGMSGTTKVILGLGLGCGFLMLLACGGLIFSSYWMFKNAVVTDPVEAQAFADGIISIKTPDGLKPTRAINFNIPLTSMGITIAIYTDENEKPCLTLCQVTGVGDDKAARDQARMQMEAQATQQMNRDGLTDQQSEEHDVEIHGEPAHFTIVAGKDRAGAEMRDVKGDFEGAHGPAMLMFRGSAEKYSDEAVKAMLDSMK